MKTRLILLPVVVTGVTAGCGSSSTLRASHEVTGGLNGSAKGAGKVLAFAPDRVWAVGPGGTLLESPNSGGFVQHGFLPSQSSPAETNGPRARPLFVAIDETEGERFYVNSDAIYVTEDGGRQWNGTKRDAGGNWAGPLLSMPGLVYAVRAHLETCDNCDRGLGPWRLYRSVDKGKTWGKVAELDPEVWLLSPAPGAGAEAIWIMTAEGLYLYRPGQPLEERDAGMRRDTGPSVVLLAASGESGGALYAAHSNGENTALIDAVYVSTNRGQRWSLRKSPFDGVVGGLIGDPGDAATAYAVAWDEGDRAAPAGASTIFRTVDGAKSWQAIWKGCLREPPSYPYPMRLDTATRTIDVQGCDGRLVHVPLHA